MLRIGVIADTHGYLDMQLAQVFGGAAWIVHAGDIGSRSVIDGLATIAPVLAVRGNVDTSPDLRDLPERLDVQLGATSVQVVHRLQDAAPQAGTLVVICGHSHKPMTEWRDRILYVNPGAAGRQWFHRDRSVCLLDLDGAPASQLVYLGPRSAHR